MDERIYLKLSGHERSIAAQGFVEAVRIFWGLLRDLDARLSGDPRGTVVWEMGTVSRENPLVLEWIGHSLLERVDHTPEIHEGCVRGLSQLREVADRPTGVDSDAALRKIQRLGELREKFFSAVEVSRNGSAAHVDALTLEHTKELFAGKYTSKGSVVGALEEIKVHEGNEFRVWDEVTGRPVRCIFPSAMLEVVKDALTHRVLVYGVVRRNHRGVATAVSVEGVDRYSEEGGPSIEEVSGLIDDLTEGQSLEDYLKELRGD